MAHRLKYQSMCHAEIDTALRSGTAKFGRWSEFANDVFARLFQDEPQRVELTGDESIDIDFYDEMHDRIGELGEFRELRDRTVGDEEFSALATQCILDDLLTRGVDDIGAIPSLQDEETAILVLDNMQEQIGAEEAERAAKEIEESYRNKAAEIASNAALVDGTKVRGAIKAAMRAAQETIDEQNALADGLAFGEPGTSAPATREERKRVSHALAAKIKEYPGIKEIIKHAGRLRRLMHSAQRAKPHPHSNDIAGVKLGRQLDEVLPDEFALLASDETEALFFDRFASSSLQMVEVKQREKKDEGPVVFCLDTSGSMRGERAAWAGGVALAFLDAAMRQKRDFVIIHFHAQVHKVERFKPAKNIDVERVVENVMLAHAGGGTSFNAPLREAFSQIENNGALENADIVFCTDGESNERLAWAQGELDRLSARLFAIHVGSHSATNIGAIATVATHIQQLVADDHKLESIFAEI